jgi:hypothetical protein
LGSAVIATNASGGQVQEALNPRDELADLLPKSIFEAEHRPCVRDLGEAVRRRRAKPLRRRIRANQLRESLLQLAILATSAS